MLPFTPPEFDQHQPREQRLHMLEAVVLHMSDGVIIVDAHGNNRHRPLQFANPAFCAMTGYSEDEISRSTPDVLKGPKTDSAEVLRLLHTVAKGQRDQFDLLCYRKDGSEFWAIIDIIPVTNAAQAPDYLVLVIRDVTRSRQAEAELRDGEQRYRLLFEHSMDAILITNQDGAILQANPAACQLLGYEQAYLLTLTAPELLGTTLDRLLDYLARTYTSGYHVGELTIKRPTGDSRVTEFVLCQIAPQLHMTILRDITERKLAEAELNAAYNSLDMRVQQRTTELVRLNQALEAEIDKRQSSEQHYRTLVETSPSAILLTDTSGIIRFCNQRAAALFGYPQVEDLYGIRTSTLVDAGAAQRASLHMILAPQQSRNIAYVMLRKNGEHFHAEASSSVVYAPDGRPTSLIVVVQDVTERKQAEDALTAAYHDVAALNRDLNDSRSLLQALFDGLEDGLLLLDAHGYVQVINRTLAELLGISPAAAIGHPWASVYQQAAPDFPGQLALDVHPIGERPTQHHRYSSPASGTRMLDLQCIRLGEGDHVEQTILHVVDVTDTVRLQEQVLRAEHFAASGRLAASVAHEINTPLQTIQTNLKLLERSVGPEHRIFLGDALDEIHRVGRIVRQLLDFYRPAATKLGPVDLGALTERVVLLLGKRIRDQHITTVREIAADVPTLYGRANELTQIILNLVVNALDVMPHGGTLSLAVQPSPDGQHILLSIGDNGPGIPPDIAEQIFEPFMTTKENGTGLGLSISKQIAEQHGGTITLSTNQRQGSTFVVALPLRRERGA